MGFKILELKLPTGFDRRELEDRIKKKLKTAEFSYTIEKQSLDARKKENIHWRMRVGVSSPALRDTEREPAPALGIPFKKRDKRVLVVGSGPAGFFCAYVLVQAGFKVTLVEQGSRAAARLKHVANFERTGQLNESDNYAFGEGGGGTFSDGKLTSRTKSISKERDFIFRSYIEAGAPAEIAYLAHPHVGSDNLVKIVANLGKQYLQRGGEFLFNTKVSDIYIKNGIVEAVETGGGKIEADYFVFAAGHSAYETYRLLMRKGVPFRVKPFAIGCRAEHPQELVNLGQWGCKALTGVKAAEYRFTFKEENHLPVYSFCMCPGGRVVPAAPYKGLNIVNGKSNYARNLPFANAAIVAGMDLNKLTKKELDPLQALEWLEQLEKKCFALSGSYAAPACVIEDFLAGRISPSVSGSSYPFPLFPADFETLLPPSVCASLRAGMSHFCKKMKGFEKGVMLGLESKTSSPVQALREKGGKSAAVENLYICGEGSGWAGGIVSSAADGIKTAVSMIS